MARKRSGRLAGRARPRLRVNWGAEKVDVVRNDCDGQGMQAGVRSWARADSGARQQFTLTIAVLTAQSGLELLEQHVLIPICAGSRCTLGVGSRCRQRKGTHGRGGQRGHRGWGDGAWGGRGGCSHGGRCGELARGGRAAKHIYIYYCARALSHVNTQIRPALARIGTGGITRKLSMSLAWGRRPEAIAEEFAIVAPAVTEIIYII